MLLYIQAFIKETVPAAFPVLPPVPFSYDEPNERQGMRYGRFLPCGGTAAGRARTAALRHTGRGCPVCRRNLSALRASYCFEYAGRRIFCSAEWDGGKAGAAGPDSRQSYNAAKLFSGPVRLFHT